MSMREIGTGVLEEGEDGSLELYIPLDLNDEAHVGLVRKVMGDEWTDEMIELSK